MLYDLSQPIFNNVPQWPKFRLTSITASHRHFAAFAILIEGAGAAWFRAVAWDAGEMA
jgi:hypothetical protein